MATRCCIMGSRRFEQSRQERARGAVAAIAVNALLGAAFVTGLAMRAEHKADTPIATFDVALTPPPPEPVVVPEPAAESPKPAGEAGRKAEASPIVAPPTPIPRPSPVTVAPVPGTGTAASSGAATSGTGTGAGGRGDGAGGGGIGTEARLLGGNRARIPRDLLRAIPTRGGYAHLLLGISASGRVSACQVTTSSGYEAIDAALCAVMVERSRWSAALDRRGQPIPVQVRYTATWSKD